MVTLFVGYGTDTFGRKRMWLLCMTSAALFTGLTYFVEDFWQLALVRMLASAFANAELAVSVTLVNEQVPARHRGFLYSIVQGGWPLGVFLAAGVYLLLGGFGWRWLFLLGIIPMILVIIARAFVRESDRFRHLQALKDARRAGDRARVRHLLQEYAVDVEELSDVTIRQLFARPGYVCRQLCLLSAIWVSYAASFSATNLYITYFLTRAKGFTASEAGTLLLVAAGIGYLLYLLGGWLGERWGRRQVLIVTALLVAPLNLLFLLVHQHALVAIAAGVMIGAALWTLLITVTDPTVTWLVVAVALALGQWLTLCLRAIPPGRELEQIAT